MQDILYKVNVEIIFCFRTNENEIKVPFGKGIAGAVAETKEPINIIDAYDVSTKHKHIVV